MVLRAIFDETEDTLIRKLQNGEKILVIFQILLDFGGLATLLQLNNKCDFLP